MGAMEDSGKDNQGTMPGEGPRAYTRKLFTSIEKDYEKKDSKSDVYQRQCLGGIWKGKGRSNLEEQKTTGSKR
jgi:hypothetical protein